jgi:hypothetical protein
MTNDVDFKVWESYHRDQVWSSRCTALAMIMISKNDEYQFDVKTVHELKQNLMNRSEREILRLEMIEGIKP